jgi:uncharacterized membrane protein
MASPRARLGVCVIVGVTVGAIVAVFAVWRYAILAGWSVALGLYVAWVWFDVGRKDAAATQALAMSEDLSRVQSELVLLAASLVNLVVVVLALVAVSGGSVVAGFVVNGGCLLSVALSWAVTHTVYALRYARVYYEHDGGIGFEDGPPDYRDFAYLAFTIGMTYQVSDTPLQTKQLRRVALRHMLLSYLFGAFIVATAINVVAGLFRG